MDNSLDLIAPYRQSAAFDDTEKDLQSLFIDVFEALFSEQIKDIHYYGMPHLGSPQVVERFTKQDGLVVLRRPTSSDLIMRVIYENWRSMASRRGLAFLEFVLQMIWSDQWAIQRLYHSKERASQYPTLVTSFPTRDSFLTSRIMIILNQEIDPDEVMELAPIISKLVPANIVANVSVGMELGESDVLQLGAAYIPYMVGNFQHFDTLESMEIAWTAWAVKRDYMLINGTVRYNGSKTNLISVMTGIADIALLNIAKTALAKTEYNQLAAVLHALIALYPKTVSYKVLTANSLIKASVLPNALSDLDAAAVMMDRLEQSQNGAFTGNVYLAALLRYLSWSYLDGVMYVAVPADLIKLSPFMYTVANITSYLNHYDAAEKHVNYLLTHDVNWSGAALQALDLKGSDEQTHVFVQHYTMPIIPPFAAWQVDENVSVVGEIAHYTAFKHNGHIYYDSYADLNLNEAVYRSLSDSDMQQLSAVITALSELTGVEDWTFDVANTQVNYIPSGGTEPLYIVFTDIALKIFANTTSAITGVASDAKSYISAIAESLFDVNALKQFVKLTDFEPLLEAHKVYRTAQPEVPYALAAMTYEFAVTRMTNPDFVSGNATQNEVVSPQRLATIFVDIRAKLATTPNANTLNNLNSAVKSAYAEDLNWPSTNALYNATIIDSSFDQVAGQILANAQNGASIAYTSAQEYLNKIAESVYLSNPSEQLIKLANLIPLFEASKVQKSLT